MRRRMTQLMLLALAAIVTGSSVSLAQMHGGAQGGHGHQQGMMQGNTQGAMMATRQIMGNIDSMMTDVSSMMRDLSAMHAGMSNAAQHDQMMGPLQGTFDQMRQLHGSLNQMMRDPAFGHDAQSMKAFQQACRNLEQMTSAFQSMTKNLTQAMKGMGGEPR